MSKPDPPFENPDEYSRHSSGGHRYFTYTYKCYAGKYLEYTFYAKGCYAWELDDIFESSGICN